MKMRNRKYAFAEHVNSVSGNRCVRISPPLVSVAYLFDNHHFFNFSTSRSGLSPFCADTCAVQSAVDVRHSAADRPVGCDSRSAQACIIHYNNSIGEACGSPSGPNP